MERKKPPEQPYAGLPKAADFGFDIEIRDHERKKKVHDALLGLWDALDFSHGMNTIWVPGDTEPMIKRQQYRLYEVLASLLLGQVPQRKVDS